MLTFVTWLWGAKYGLDDVQKLRRGIARHLQQPFRFFLMTEREREVCALEGIERHAIKDPHLTKIPGCFARLRVFDAGWQANRMIDDRLVNIDLDCIITGPLDPLFDRPEPFVILAMANSVNPCPFNGSVFMLRRDQHQEVWRDFSVEAAQRMPFYKFPDDQGWLAQKIPNGATWRAGWRSGIYAFKKRGWPAGSDDLPGDARMVVFPGYREPKQFLHLKWVRKNWA